MDSEKDDVATGLFAIVGVLAMLPSIVFWRTFYVKTIWNWLAPKIFMAAFGWTVPELPMRIIFGIMLIISAVEGSTYRHTFKEDKWSELFNPITFGLFMLVYAWIFKTWFI